MPTMAPTPPPTTPPMMDAFGFLDWSDVDIIDRGSPPLAAFAVAGAVDDDVLLDVVEALGKIVDEGGTSGRSMNVDIEEVLDEVCVDKLEADCSLIGVRPAPVVFANGSNVEARGRMLIVMGRKEGAPGIGAMICGKAAPVLVGDVTPSSEAKDVAVSGALMLEVGKGRASVDKLGVVDDAADRLAITENTNGGKPSKLAVDVSESDGPATASADELESRCDTDSPSDIESEVD
jgi:hypothetical protein